jgi:L-iditol 2-dehydrogenase
VTSRALSDDGLAAMSVRVPKDMRACVLVAPGEVRITELPVPSPADGEVLIRTIASAICGSDFHTLDHGITGLALDDGPSDRFGHESVGRVVKSCSPRFSPGELVLAAPTVEVGRTFAEYQAVQDRFLIGLPEGPDPIHLLMAQQLGTVIFAMKSFLGPQVPATAAVYGLGPAGLNFVQYLRHIGVRTIIGVDRHPWRLEAAAEMGAAHTVDVGSFDPVGTIGTLTAGNFVDLAVEAAGSNVTRRQAVQSVARNGRVGLFGAPEHDAPDFAFPLGEVFRRTPSVSMMVDAQYEPGLSSFATAARLIAEGSMQPAALISHRFELSDMVAALRAARTPLPGVRKVVVEVAGATG